MTPRYARSPAVLWRRTGDTVVMLSMDGGDVVELSGTGSALWDVLAGPISQEEASEVLSRLFAAPLDVVAGDVGPVLRELLDRSLVAEVGDE